MKLLLRAGIVLVALGALTPVAIRAESSREVQIERIGELLGKLEESLTWTASEELIARREEWRREAQDLADGLLFEDEATQEAPVSDLRSAARLLVRLSELARPAGSEGLAVRQRYLERALELIDRLGERKNPETAPLLKLLSVTAEQRGDLARAEAYNRERVANLLWNLIPVLSDLENGWDRQAQLQRRQGRHEDARRAEQRRNLAKELLDLAEPAGP